MNQHHYIPNPTNLRRDWEIKDLQREDGYNYMSVGQRVLFAADHNFRYYDRHTLQTNQTQIKHEANRR